MSFFSATKSKEKLKPRTAESKAGGSWLMDFMKRWESDYPQQQVAGLTDLQRADQGRLADYQSKGTEGYNLAMGQTRKTLAGDYDPRTSDYWKGFRQEGEQVRGKSNEAIRRRAQAGGMLQSSPYANIEAQANRELDSFMLRKLGELYETERGRQDTAANRAGNLGQQQFGNLLAGQGMAEMPRMIEELRNAAIYEEQIQELLHAYTYQANIAQAMMGYSPGTYNQPGGPSEWTKAVSVATDIGKLATGTAFLPEGAGYGGGYGGGYGEPPRYTLGGINRGYGEY